MADANTATMDVADNIIAFENAPNGYFWKKASLLDQKNTNRNYPKQ
jgi:hypothetical protein